MEQELQTWWTLNIIASRSCYSGGPPPRVVQQYQSSIPIGYGTHIQQQPFLVKDKTVKLNLTPKAHQIGDHFEQYFDDTLVKPEGLGMCSDQIIEHMHSYIKRMMLKSRYLCSIADSEESAKRQHNGILRLVSFSVRNKQGKQCFQRCTRCERFRVQASW